MYGIIDLGSNTIRLSVYKVNKPDFFTPLFHKKLVVGLAGYIDKYGCLSEKGISAALDALMELRAITDNVSFKGLYAFATASLRNIKNGKEVLTALREKSGFDLKVLSGKDEAIYGYIGASYASDFENGILADVGGGSTELVFYKNSSIENVISFPFGSLNLYTKFVSEIFPDKNEAKKIKNYVKEFLKKNRVKEFEKMTLCAVGGTARAASKLNNEIFNLPVSNSLMEMNNVSELLGILDHRTKDNILKILRTIPERTHTIFPGLIIFHTIADFYCCDQFTVSSYGVREGYLLSILNGSEYTYGKYFL